jgi:L-ascorbate metabolism protein UlaG (beta-lactamase superfamily)
LPLAKARTVFNRQVANTGWIGMRAYHDQALIDEFQRRGIDVSVVSDGHNIHFAKSVKYDISENRLLTIS